MAQIDLNIPLIRDSKGRDFVKYLDELRENHSDVAICQSLLEAVELEHLDPKVFSVFLPWSKSLDNIILCIHHSSSRFVRSQGVKHFGKVLADPKQWESAWRAVGGTKGLVNILAKGSVTEVAALVGVIGRCNRGQHKIGAREKAIENLLKVLLPSHHHAPICESHDNRPIHHRYAQMVPACSPEFVDHLLETKDQSSPLYRCVPSRRLIMTHGELLQRRAIEGIFGDGCDEEDRLHQSLQTFAYFHSPGHGPDIKVSSSMAFAMKVLKLRLEHIDNDRRWPAKVSETGIFLSLLRRSIKRRLPEVKLHDILMLGLHLLEAKPKLKPAFQPKKIWAEIMTRFRKVPKLYEDSVVLALRLELGGSPTTICRDFLQTSQAIKTRPEERWPLLRLYCLHVPKRGVDIDMTTDFKPLAKQPWSSDIFYHLSQDQAVRLLTGLLGLQSANPEYGFLQGPARASILSNRDLMFQPNFIVGLLFAILQRNSEELQIKARITVDELRKKAATSREQSERARFAKAAANYAIASGNLDLYGETVTWQQRYIRDPLTLKVIFDYDAVATIEGIELLSGIPKPLPDTITFTEIASSVKKADDILMRFHETMLMAKREPSFYEPDWADVMSLFGAAISERVDRAVDLQKHLQSPELDVYNAMWGGTLAMLEKVDLGFIIKAYTPIKALLEKLPPTSLAVTTRAMLESGNEKRKKQNRQPGDDMLERLFYEMLQKLAAGDKPELAQELIFRTIIDRPDASSWHRKLLSMPFMNSLSAEDANEIFRAFTTAIGEKLEEQSYVKVGETLASPSAPTQSLVKVTTVKYLAQLLEKGEFITVDASVEVLVELLKVGTHQDIRLATLDSLLSLLNNLCTGADEDWRSIPLVAKIMGALETVVSVVGSVNERRPPRLEDWKEATETGTLPDISDISFGLPSLMSAMITAPDNPQRPGLKKLQAEFVERFLLPALEHSQVEHRKWVILFLAKHKAKLNIDDLPPTPISPLAWRILVEKYPKLLPQRVLEDFNKHMVMTIAPPAALKHFNESIRKDLDLCNTPEVLHWLSVFGESMTRYSASGTQTLVRMIHHDWTHPLVRHGIATSKVIEMVIEHASLFLDEYDMQPHLWNDFVHDLRHPRKVTYPDRDEDSIRSMFSTWQETGRIVLQQVLVLLLDRKNTHEREHKRSILPSTMQLRLSLLQYPCLPEAAEVDNDCESFAKQLEDLLETFLKVEANVLQWPKIANDAFTISVLLNTNEERLRTASYIGELLDSSGRARDQRTSALNFVRVALAMKLIEDGQEALNKIGKGKLTAREKKLVQCLRRRIEEWQDDFDEGIREKVADWKRERKDVWEKLNKSET